MSRSGTRYCNRTASKDAAAGAQRASKCLIYELEKICVSVHEAVAIFSGAGRDPTRPQCGIRAARIIAFLVDGYDHIPRTTAKMQLQFVCDGNGFRRKIGVLRSDLRRDRIIHASNHAPNLALDPFELLWRQLLFQNR